MDLYTLNSLSQIRYREMLQEAEYNRLCRKTKNSQATRQHLFTRVGDVLIVLGQRMKGQAQTHPATPTFHTR